VGFFSACQCAINYCKRLWEDAGFAAGLCDPVPSAALVAGVMRGMWLGGAETCAAVTDQLLTALCAGDEAGCLALLSEHKTQLWMGTLNTVEVK
jgi:hypothetical protein